MPASIGVNLRVTGYCSQGGRKYMEDFFSVAYQQSADEKDLEFAFIGIYDGHGGSEAATFAKEHLINLIVSQKLFWSENDKDILRAIRNGYVATHWAMWREQDKWPKTASGLPSTAGTTASVAFIRHGKIFIGHAGDSGIVLGYTDDNDKTWNARPLTIDHKPESNVEKERIENSGGKVAIKSGVPRVVWNRPRLGHKGPVRRSTPIDEIPFLAVARSLGDLWSYNSALNEFVVSPEPDVRVLKIDPKKHRCLVFGTDGLWNVLTPDRTVEIVRYAEQVNDRSASTGNDREWINPSKCLVDKALERWSKTKMRADNTSAVILMLDPPGPPGRPKRDGLRITPEQPLHEPYKYEPELIDKNFTMYDHSTKAIVNFENHHSYPSNGMNSLLKYDELNDYNNHEVEKSHDYCAASPACASDLSSSSSYTNSYTESYNSLLNSPTYNDHSYTLYQPSHLHDAAIQYDDDTYSLTKLETRSEQYSMRNVYDQQPCTSAIYHNYYHNNDRHFDQHNQQYNCPNSSHFNHFMRNELDPGIIPGPSTSSYHLHHQQHNLDYTIPSTSNVIVESIDATKELWPMETTDSGFPIQQNTINPLPQSIPFDSNETICNVDAAPVDVMTILSSSSNVIPTTNDPIDISLDETIQINEISSSSKENDERSNLSTTTTTQMIPAETIIDIYPEPSNRIVNATNNDAFVQSESVCRNATSIIVDCQRITRSKKSTNLNQNSTIIRKVNKNRCSTLRNFKTKMLELIKLKKLIKVKMNNRSNKIQNVIQNENFNLKPLLRSQRLTTTAAAAVAAAVATANAPAPSATTTRTTSASSRIVSPSCIDIYKRTLRSKNTITKDSYLMVRTGSAAAVGPSSKIVQQQQQHQQQTDVSSTKLSPTIRLSSKFDLSSKTTSINKITKSTTTTPNNNKVQITNIKQRDKIKSNISTKLKTGIARSNLTISATMMLRRSASSASASAATAWLSNGSSSRDRNQLQKRK